MVIAAGIVLALVLGGAIALETRWMGKRFDQRMDGEDGEPS